MNRNLPTIQRRLFICALGVPLGILAVLFGGCASTETKLLEGKSIEEWKAMAEVPITSPQRELSTLNDTPSEAKPEPAVEPEQELPTIPVQNLILTQEMDVAVLLRALADAAGLNVLIGKGVSGPVLISLRGESRWDRLFLAIVHAHGLHYVLEEDLLRILSQEDVQRQIAMETALHERLKATQLRAEAEPLQLEVFPVRYADPEKLAASLRAAFEEDKPETIAALEGEKTTSFVRADPDSGLLLVRAIPANMERARNLIRAMDQPAIQILIEASIVQASSDTARELGVRWGAFNISDGGELMTGTTPRGDGFNSNFPAPFDPAGPGFTFGVERITDSELLQAQLSALQKDGLLNIVASPSITTIDKQTAVIESGEERPFQSAVGTGIAALPQIEFKRAVLRLEVTPHVIDENWVKLVIDTTKDEFDDTRAVIIEGNLHVPIITRAAMTTLYLADGQTTVIGGLTSETQTNTEEGIPLLKDIPLLGGLFRNSTNRTALSDTLIFITPHILSQAETL